MPADDLYRACAEACLAVIGYIPGTDAYTALAAYRSGRPEFRAAIDLAVRAGRERADCENYDRGRAAGYDIGYAEGRRHADAERADTCGTRDISCTCPTRGTAAPVQTAASGTTPPGEGDPVGAGASGAQRAAQAVVDAAICRRSERVDDPTAHSWRFDGDDPRIVCVYCGQERDAQSGQILREATVDGDRQHAQDWTGYDEQMGWYAARCTCGYTAVSRYSLLGAARILDDHLAARAEADRA